MYRELVTNGLTGYSIDLVTGGLGLRTPSDEHVVGGLLGYSDLVTGGLGQGPSVAPTTATLSGPFSGPVNAASSNFTVTLDQPAQSGGVSCPVASSVGGDTITSTPVVIVSGQTTGAFTITPRALNGIGGVRYITLGATTPSLTIAGSPIAYNAVSTAYPMAMMMEL